MSTLQDVVSKVKVMAPVLGQALASSNPISNVIYTLICKVFGSNKSNPDDLLRKINDDPEAQIKLKRIEYEHEESLSKINSDNYKTEVEDRKNARDFQVQTHSLIPTFLAIGYFITYSVIQFYCLMHPAQSNDIISARLHDGFMVVLAYFFGRNHEQFMRSNK